MVRPWLVWAEALPDSRGLVQIYLSRVASNDGVCRLKASSGHGGSWAPRPALWKLSLGSAFLSPPLRAAKSVAESPPSTGNGTAGQTPSEQDHSASHWAVGICQRLSTLCDLLGRSQDLQKLGCLGQVTLKAPYYLQI